MGFRFSFAVFLFIFTACICGSGKAYAESAKRNSPPFGVDFSASGLVPITWAQDSPTLSALGVDVLLGIEYDSSVSLPVRLEIGYIGVGHSRIAPTGELYRGWDGARFALLAGYNFAPIPLKDIGRLDISLMGGGALTAAAYASTPLAYAYPSAILEPRIILELGENAASGPWLSLPTELMFRAGDYTIAPGLSLGWLYRFGGAR
jgi:hypothetical protein